MREIKFRAKRIDNGHLVFGQYFKTPLTDENSGAKPDEGWYFLSGKPRHCIAQDGVSFVIDEKTLGQYSGLKDKNGKEIYEGDIVNREYVGLHPNRINDFVGAVEFYEGTYFVENPNDKSECAFLFDEIATNVVIGNIYENPEILGREETCK